MFYKLKHTLFITFLILVFIFITESISIGDEEQTVIKEEKFPIIEEKNENLPAYKDLREVFDFTMPDGIGTGEFSTPLCGRFTSGYGQRWGRLHGGIDIAAKVGTPIKASDSGKVIFTGNCGSYGLLVKIDHQNGYVTYYAHCSEIKVSLGDCVNKGDIISLVGNTGNSTGPHCHFEIRHNNKPENPLNYVKI